MLTQRNISLAFVLFASAPAWTGCSRKEASAETATSAPSAPAASVESALKATPPAGTSPLCEAPHKLVANPETCLACEKRECDRASVGGCSKYPEGSDDRKRCDDVLTCIRSTNCIAQGNVYCYCGVADIVACKESAANANGVCKDRIAAAFPAGETSTDLVNHIGDVSIAGGAALALGFCDQSRCGETQKNECVPYCK
jgi:hypothetical protein